MQNQDNVLRNTQNNKGNTVTERRNFKGKGKARYKNLKTKRIKSGKATWHGHMQLR